MVFTQDLCEGSMQHMAVADAQMKTYVFASMCGLAVRPGCAFA
jgi:hypothetical protein